MSKEFDIYFSGIAGEKCTFKIVIRHREERA